ncbi:helix-turn-helix domain-containing protein [Marinimicrobium agarilyticum]|uniref:helix-turn-helix domain-containing protein n=1 Tax=Marinimicrobium agarilyticum TaxID=306546 RepID=UPI001FE210F6|nr:helix-turn-helix domain-containing protein [Marinimicrobium agarilyticum]
MKRPDHHNEVEVNLLRSGSVTYLLGGKTVTVEAGKMSAFWAAIPHQIVDYSNVKEYFVATIPLQMFFQWRLPDAFVQPLMQGQCLSEPGSEGITQYDAMLFKSWVADLSGCTLLNKRPVMLEMQARMERFARRFLGDTENRVESSLSSGLPDSRLNKVEKMACFVAKNYTKKVTVQQVGHLVDLHPNYAMKLFQKTFGTTLISYLTQLRVSHAQRLLSTTDLPITEIALESGFSSISRFNDAFYSSCGQSPRAYRNAG